MSWGTISHLSKRSSFAGSPIITAMGAGLCVGLFMSLLFSALLAAP